VRTPSRRVRLPCLATDLLIGLGPLR